jgi:hypothetical protein
MTVADQLKKWAKGRDSKPLPYAKKPLDAESVKDRKEEKDDEEVTAGSDTPVKDDNPLEAYKRKIAEGKGKPNLFAKVKKG